MPDFSAISSLIGGIKNVLDGITKVTGSLAGEGVGDLFEAISGSSDLA